MTIILINKIIHFYNSLINKIQLKWTMINVKHIILIISIIKLI